MRRRRFSIGIYTLELAVTLPIVLALIVGAVDVTNILRARFAVSAALNAALDSYRLAPGVRTGADPAARLETARRQSLLALQAIYPAARLQCAERGAHCANVAITPRAGVGVNAAVALQLPLIYLSGDMIEVSEHAESLTEEQAIPRQPVLFENALPH